MKIKIALLPVLLLCSFYCKSQVSYTGIWKGTINKGKSSLVYLTIKDSSDHKQYCTVDMPDQMAYDIAGKLTVRNDSLMVTFGGPTIGYSGMKITADSIAGVAFRGSHYDPLNLKRTNKGITLNRPQTPAPPFPYISENVTYQNSDKTLTYGATITIPKGKGKFPAILLVTGSGQQNRDEEIVGHKPFAVIADYLTRRGYIVLRVDDRGTGETTGDYKSSTTMDFANDAEASLRYLRRRKEVNLKKIGIAGHSEGGMIAPMIAARDKSIDFIILLAGPGEKISQLMHEQNELVREKAGIAREAIDSYMVLSDQMVQSVISNSDTGQLKKELAREVNEWRSHTPYNIVFATTNAINDSTANLFVNAIFSSFATPWWRYFLSYDPVPNLEQLSCKVLALGGDKDIQVPAKSNLEGLRNALAKSKTKNYDVIELKGLNHLFQKCHSCNTQEYVKLEETFSPDALAVMGDWLDKNVK